MTNEQALYALVSGTGLTLTVDGGCEDESSFVSNVTFFADANDPRIPSWVQIQAKFTELEADYDALAYARSRKGEYDVLNQLELISDDTKNGTTTHIDAIAAIKAKYPKPE